jgi:TRAP-type mannitol/chloroaromatic compound transport system permease small subunit
MKNKGLLTLLGYLLFLLGVTSIVMELVGTHWYFLGWLERTGRLFAFVLKILMIMGGVLLIVFSRTDWEREKRESSEEGNVVD